MLDEQRSPLLHRQRHPTRLQKLAYLSPQHTQMVLIHAGRQRARDDEPGRTIPPENRRQVLAQHIAGHDERLVVVYQRTNDFTLFVVEG
jgi:uncharacterized protein YciI